MGKTIIIILLLAIFIGGVMIVYEVKRKVREAARAAFGVDSISEGLAMQADLLENTPKSVSGMTKIYLPRIIKDFPEFNYYEFKQKVEEGIKEKLDSPELPGEVYRDISIHQTEITRYIRKKGTCVVVFQSAVGYLYYQEENGKIIAGSKERKRQTKYNTELVYIQDEEKVENMSGGAIGMRCPNCGAPITGLGRKQCEYCGGQVSELNIHVWSLGRIYEVK